MHGNIAIMNIALSDRWKKFVRSRVARGRYGSEAEVMDAALALLQRQEVQLDLLRREIEAGRRSGKPRPFDPEGIKRRGRARLAAQAK